MSRRWTTEENDLTGLEFGCWTVLGKAGKTTKIWLCQCKCGYQKPFNRQHIRYRRFYRSNIGCIECFEAAWLGKGNIKSTPEDRHEVSLRRTLGNKAAERRWEKSCEGDRQESNRNMNEARLNKMAAAMFKRLPLEQIFKNKRLSNAFLQKVLDLAEEKEKKRAKKS